MASDFERSYPGASALATECVLNLAFLSGRVETYGQALVRAAGVPSLAAFNVLTILDGDAEPLPPSTIAERMILRRSTMVEIVRSLERRRLIRRFPHPHDGRMVLLEITADGRERVRAVAAATARSRTPLDAQSERIGAAITAARSRQDPGKRTGCRLSER